MFCSKKANSDGGCHGVSEFGDRRQFRITIIGESKLTRQELHCCVLWSRRTERSIGSNHLIHCPLFMTQVSHAFRVGRQRVPRAITDLCFVPEACRAPHVRYWANGLAQSLGRRGRWHREIWYTSTCLVSTMIAHLADGAHDQVWVVLAGLEELERRGSRSCCGKAIRHGASLLQDVNESQIC